jgi:YfiR/HmsC-like
MNLRRIMACAASILWIACLTLLPAHSARPQERVHSAVSVKAAFLYNFAGYVEWPKDEQPGDAIIVGIVGDDEMVAELRRIVPGRTVQNRPVSVRAVRGTDELARVDILFIGQSESARLPQLVRAARQRPVLIVTDAENGLEQDSMINFVLADSRVRFEVSPANAERAGLKLSSRLLSVAFRIRKGHVFPGTAIAGTGPAYPVIPRERDGYPVWPVASPRYVSTTRASLASSFAGPSSATRPISST